MQNDDNYNRFMLSCESLGEKVQRRSLVQPSVADLQAISGLHLVILGSSYDQGRDHEYR